MKTDGRVKLAGLIGKFFQIDPVLVLKSSHREWAIRQAAYESAVEAMNKAQEDANKPDDKGYSSFEG